MAYTPELSTEAFCTLRRIAWALNVPMTKAIERVFEHLPRILDKHNICEACIDKTKCSACLFSQNLTKGEDQ
jgi:hypothetical protein